MLHVVDPSDAPESCEKWVIAFDHVAGIAVQHMIYASEARGIVQICFNYNGQSSELVVTRDTFENMGKDDIEIYIGQRFIQNN